jgi:hypothetical protein
MLFFDLLEANLNLDKPSHKIAANVLALLQSLYEYQHSQTTGVQPKELENRTAFSQLKNLIDTSKKIQNKLSLSLVSAEEYNSIGGWDADSRAITITEPTNASGFLNSLLSYLYRSVNDCFANPLELAKLATQISSGNYFSLALKLAEYYYQHSTTRNTIKELHQDATLFMENFEQIHKELLQNHILTEEATDPMSLPEFLNATHQPEHQKAIIEMHGVFNSSITEELSRVDQLTLEHYFTPSESPEEFKLTEIVSTIISEIKNNSFDLAATKQKHLDFLNNALATDLSLKEDYYAVFQLLLNNGHKHNIPVMNHVFELMELLVQLGQGILNLESFDPAEKELVFVGLDMLESYYKTNSFSQFDLEVQNTYWPKLEQTRQSRPDLAEKYQTSLFSFNQPLATIPAKTFLQQCLLQPAAQDIVDKTKEYLLALEQDQAAPVVLTFAYNTATLATEEAPTEQQELTNQTEDNQLSPSKKLKLS